MYNILFLHDKERKISKPPISPISHQRALYATLQHNLTSEGN